METLIYVTKKVFQYKKKKNNYNKIHEKWYGVRYFLEWVIVLDGSV